MGAQGAATSDTLLLQVAQTGRQRECAMPATIRHGPLTRAINPTHAARPEWHVAGPSPSLPPQNRSCPRRSAASPAARHRTASAPLTASVSSPLAAACPNPSPRCSRQRTQPPRPPSLRSPGASQQRPPASSPVFPHDDDRARPCVAKPVALERPNGGPASPCAAAQASVLLTWRGRRLVETGLVETKQRCVPCPSSRDGPSAALESPPAHARQRRATDAERESIFEVTITTTYLSRQPPEGAKQSVGGLLHSLHPMYFLILSRAPRPSIATPHSPAP